MILCIGCQETYVEKEQIVGIINHVQRDEIFETVLLITGSYIYNILYKDI